MNAAADHSAAQRQQSQASGASPRDEREALRDGWLDAVLAVAAHYQLDASRERIRVASLWNSAQPVGDGARHMARQAGLSLSFVAPKLARLNAWRLPAVVQLSGGQVAVITALTAQGLCLAFSGDSGAETT